LRSYGAPSISIEGSVRWRTHGCFYRSLTDRFHVCGVHACGTSSQSSEQIAGGTRLQASSSHVLHLAAFRSI
jgi:hypothetical protein